MRAKLLAAALLITLAGCILLVDPNSCATSDQCPSGQSCVGGDCHSGAGAPLPDGGGASGGTGGTTSGGSGTSGGTT